MELAERLARAARALANQRSLTSTLEQVATLAVEVVPGIDAAGISVFDRGVTTNAVSTDSWAGSCESLQVRFRQGPAVDREPSPEVRLIDLRADKRWPRFTARARRLGVRAIVACHLPGQRTAPARLNLYTRHALEPDAVEIAGLYTTHAAIAVSHATQVEHLTTAMTSRERIGKALGVLMHRHNLAADQAFDLLVQVSQHLNVKLRDLADIVLETTTRNGETTDMARRPEKDPGARLDEPRQRHDRSDASPVPGSEPLPLTTAEERARITVARTIYQLAESTAHP